MNRPLAVVVATRNRPDHAAPCVRSVLANGGEFELVLVDQSDGDRTQDSIAASLSDPRFRYLKSAMRGASNGRNAGVAATSAPVIAFTDDDCRAASDWLERTSAVFAGDSRIGIVFGRVAVPDELRGTGFAAEFDPPEREYDRRFPAAGVAWGIGANMAVRRAVFDQVGGFDPWLGPGAPFNAGEECDLMIRAISSGWKVLNARESFVAHLGVREGAEASRLMRGYGVAMGATLLKHVRLGTDHSHALALSWLAHFGGRGLKNALLGRKPSGLGLFAGILRGAYQSLQRPLDRERGIFAVPASH